MKNKFYTPKIEEFHVGFEYESYNGKVWSKEISETCYSDQAYICLPIPEKDYGYDYENTRVKYLDLEDIESLGWKFKEIEKGMLSNRPIFKFKTYLLNFDRNEHGIWLLITDEYVEYQHFSGQVKNKSELKKLMQMLNIEK